MGRKLTQNEVINRFEFTHKEKYDYSEVKYSNMRTKVDIICNKHGKFSIKPQNHIEGQGCNSCGNELKRLSKKEFIEKANKKHNNFYDYSKTEYVINNKEVIIMCPLHGEFKQTPNTHLSGCGCQICGGKDNRETFIKKCKEKWGYDYTNTIYEGSHEFIEYRCLEHGIMNQIAYHHLLSGCVKCSRIKFNKKTFLIKAAKIHGNRYDYSKIISVNGINDFVEIICKSHGSFIQKVDIHLKGSNCSKCSDDSQRVTFEEFIERSNKIHNFLYDYSKSIFGGYNDKINIVCKIHGEFNQTTSHHLKGAGCPICKLSKGELKILNFLILHNIKFIRNKKFPNCKNTYELPFDFYLPDYNICIEYDGEMHFKIIERFGGIEKLKVYRKNDNKKTIFCKDEDIKLIRIKYTKFNKIEKILQEKLKHCIIDIYKN